MTSLTTQNLIYSTSVVAMEGKPNKFAFSLYAQARLGYDRQRQTLEYQCVFFPNCGLCGSSSTFGVGQQKTEKLDFDASKEHMANQISVTQ